MKQLTVPHLPELHRESPLSFVSERLDQLPAQRIDVAPWADGGKPAEATFTIAHHADCLYLKYKVAEETVLARYRSINDPVYRDSCVEFFVCFANDSAYYNIEANCLGTCLVGYGPDRHNRKQLPAALISGIEHHAHLRVLNNGHTGKSWELTLRIPAALFEAQSFASFEGLQARGNFYKCGDDLPEPHYLAWNPIEAPEPDFHRPEHFGSIVFA
ncbi:carbohydrate-binding family 9-like protein [Pontibacter litorisediminis]|uniref:carbohydrate-binding family 9-like protein n=1 Tax=Pontibacter litorisediminis TaxID=1846260 RepID=UPI0023EDE7EF|nr:carbohydrate-binding family 9-like protein [Pontibacter litorisediminis]